MKKVIDVSMFLSLYGKIEKALLRLDMFLLTTYQDSKLKIHRDMIISRLGMVYGDCFIAAAHDWCINHSPFMITDSIVVSNIAGLRRLYLNVCNKARKYAQGSSLFTAIRRLRERPYSMSLRELGFLVMTMLIGNISYLILSGIMPDLPGNLFRLMWLFLGVCALFSEAALSVVAANSFTLKYLDYYASRVGDVCGKDEGAQL